MYKHVQVVFQATEDRNSMLMLLSQHFHHPARRQQQYSIGHGSMGYVTLQSKKHEYSPPAAAPDQPLHVCHHLLQLPFTQHTTSSSTT
jgi:hypothetical protein